MKYKNMFLIKYKNMFLIEYKNDIIFSISTSPWFFAFMSITRQSVLVEPAWLWYSLWYSLPGVRIRNETEISLVCSLLNIKQVHKSERAWEKLLAMPKTPEKDLNLSSSGCLPQHSFRLRCDRMYSRRLANYIKVNSQKMRSK